MPPVVPLLCRSNRFSDGAADIGGPELDLQGAGLQPGDAQQVVDDADEALGLARDVAEERLALGIGEVDVAALEVSAKP